ncbi:competence protein ComEC [Labrenzia sp. EL_208]|nr:competence protein ComEC [Labrenzia sp. EL_132]MBG6233127.1 competence protein ComEC [Labrenzia sp. EL_208]
MFTVSHWENQALLWICFSFAAGIAAYVLLPVEPFWPFLVLSLLVCVLFSVWRGYRDRLNPLILLGVAFWAGLTCATLRTAYVSAPRLGEEMNVSLTGRVLERLERANSVRLVLAVESINDRPIEDIVFPAKVRVSVPAATLANSGNRVRLRARLFPPSGPVLPGGYDFSFRAFFLQIGATGFSFGAPQLLSDGEMPVWQKADVLIQVLRQRIADRIATHLPADQETALVVALLVGDRSGIDETQEENLRAAGLAHILAISGLHMALFAGGAYAAVLFLLALLPPLTLRWPIHKFAAVAALLAAIFYLAVSGASVATQRSFLMITLVFLGILVGRRGLTLRSVALAGLLLLLLAPERLFSPGFQMSFAAVICLVAVYETWRDRREPFAGKNRRQQNLPGRVGSTISNWMAGLVITALVAGLATGIIAAYHFGRVAPLGMLGNLLGMPVFTLLVMPMGVLAMIMMPFGLASLPLAAMSLGITLLLKIAAFVAELDGGAGAIGRLTAFEAFAFSIALFACLLLRGWWRSCALVPFTVGLILVLFSQPPDVQIAATGTRISARDINGDLNWLGGRRTFLVDVWYQTEGVPAHEIMSHKMKSPQKTCDSDGCVIKAYTAVGGDEEMERPPAPLLIAMPKSQKALALDCRYADLIVSDLIVPATCGAKLVIDGGTRQVRGAVSLWLSAEVLPVINSSPDTPATYDDTEIANAIHVAKIRYAIAAAPRPWHERGGVTRAELQ